MKHLVLPALLLLSTNTLIAQGRSEDSHGAITTKVLERIQSAQSKNSSGQALNNALRLNGIDMMATQDNSVQANDIYFSHEAPSKGITDQEQSGRCWLFTGLNVMRAHVIRENKIGEFEFSQSYNSFFDLLEKSNLFLQSIIDEADKPMTDQKVEWLFRNPISDGGTFSGVQDVVTKYGAVPAEVMPESKNANSTSRMLSIISQKLREYGLTLRKAYEAGEKKQQIEDRKVEMLAVIYHILSSCLGDPPMVFTYAMKDERGRVISRETYTPQTFYRRYVGWDLKNDYVMLMNDPSRPFYKTYTIDLDRHSYDGKNWTYINLPIEDIKQMAIASIKDSTRMYFSCDVGKFYNKKTGLLSLQNYDYASLFNIDFPMPKSERIKTFESASSHAMTLCAVDLEEGTERPLKWKVENSWGIGSGVAGHLIMTDQWFNEFMFRLVVQRKYVPESILKLLNQKPTLLPAWDPLFQEDE